MPDAGDLVEALFVGLMVILVLSAIQNTVAIDGLINISLLTQLFELIFVALIIVFILSIVSQALD
jgi:hypothetical protein